MGVAEIAAAPLAVGLLAGGVFGITDVLVHTRQSFPTDIFYAVAFAAPPAAAALLALCIPIAAAVWLARGRPQRSDWLALVCGTACVGLVAAVLLLTSVGIGGGDGFIFLCASLVAAIALALALARVPPLRRPGVGLAWMLAALLILTMCSSAMLYLDMIGLPWIAGVVCVAIGAMLAAVVVLQPRAAWWIVGGLAAVNLALLGIGDPPQPVPARFSSADGRPNVIVFVLDTTRADHLGAYGDQRGLSPRLDELAAEAVVYEDAYSTSHWTVPSHASLFTGLHPITHGCTRLERLRLEDHFDTLAELLQADGYSTAALYSNVWLQQANLLQGFDTTVYLDRNYIGLWLLPLASAVGAPARWIDKGGAISERELAAWLARERTPDAPFFLFVNLLEAHSTYVAPRDQRREQLPPGVASSRAGALARGFQPNDWHLTGADNPDAESIVPAMYAAEVRYQDAVLGRLLEVLRAATEFDRNLIVVTADHGENLHEAYRWGHEFEINDNLAHVPLIVRYPRPGAAPGRVDGLTQITDIMPTVFDVLGKPLPVVEATGRSLRPATFEPWEGIALHEAPEYASLGAIYGRKQLSEPAFRRFMAPKRAYRTGRYKYVWSADGRDALYDLEEDPLELDNRIESLPEIAVELREKLAGWREAQPVFVPTEQPDDEGPMSEELLRQLRALGYIR